MWTFQEVFELFWHCSTFLMRQTANMQSTMQPFRPLIQPLNDMFPIFSTIFVYFPHFRPVDLRLSIKQKSLDSSERRMGHRSGPRHHLLRHRPGPTGASGASWQIAQRRRVKSTIFFQCRWVAPERMSGDFPEITNATGFLQMRPLQAVLVLEKIYRPSLGPSPMKLRRCCPKCRSDSRSFKAAPEMMVEGRLSA